MFRAPALAQSFKKFCADVLVEQYSSHEQTINKLAKSIESDEDYLAIVNLTKDLYEAGYVKSVEDHKKVLKDYNINLQLKRFSSKEEPVKPIFPQEKSG